MNRIVYGFDVRNSFDKYFINAAKMGLRCCHCLEYIKTYVEDATKHEYDGHNYVVKTSCACIKYEKSIWLTGSDFTLSSERLQKRIIDGVLQGYKERSMKILIDRYDSIIEAMQGKAEAGAHPDQNQS